CEGIDAILEEVKALGRHESVVHISGARFGAELIVLVHPHAQYDWVLPALKSRLLAAWTRLNMAVDSRKTREVHMGPGAVLTFLGHEFRYLAPKGEAAHVAYKRLKKKRPSWSARLLSPFRAMAGALGRLVPSLRRAEARAAPRARLSALLSPLQEARRTLGTALASAWRALPLLFFYAVRYFVKVVWRQWELVGLAVCGLAALWLFLE